MSDFPHFRKFLDTQKKKMDIRYKQVGLHNEYIIIKLFYTSFALICHVDYIKSNPLIFILMNLHFEKNTLRLSLSNSQSPWIKSKTLCTGMNMSAMFYIKLRSKDFSSWKHHQISTSTAMLTLNVLCFRGFFFWFFHLFVFWYVYFCNFYF